MDFDKDGWMDVALTHDAAPGISLWHNEGAKKFTRVRLPELGWTSGFGIAALDYDNDGWVDLVAVGRMTRSHRLRCFATKVLGIPRRDEGGRARPDLARGTAFHNSVSISTVMVPWDC